ncbi:MAG: helicase-exonuclease AddAB subunit AddA [Ruminococcaceae bacterium]|nr:helicase-exonuclease AddAB subunit AddA [Oscillospiraceae bacterium]
MANIQLTEEQSRAVYDRGGSLLVSAAAGSGKTKVLVERLFTQIREQGCDVDDFLIITYTKAAAAELRGKIAQELSRRVAEEPGNAHLRRQMYRVYQADIKTVDAFCAGLLRKNVHLLQGNGQHSLTPDFRVLDEPESKLMKQRVLSRVLEEFYARLEQENSDERLLAETLGAGRDDRALEALVLELHGKIQSHPHPLRWLDGVRASWEALPQELAGSDYGRVMMDDTVRRALFWAQKLEKAVAAMADHPKLLAAYGDRFAQVAAQLRLLESAAADGWQAMGRVHVEFPRLGAVRGEDGDTLKDTVKRVWEQCKKDVRAFTAIYAAEEEELLEDLRSMAPAMLALIRLTGEFARQYQNEKLRRNAVDFSDQEHYAIEILTDGDGRPTELAKQTAQRYHEIMVDEFQDTNEVQNYIFRAISRQEQNLFVVGDVKQSIYRFRLADPTIFLEKYLAYVPAEDAQEGEARKVLLSRNFRSRQTVLDATNFVFGNIMSRAAGEMDYGEEERLYCGAAYYLPRSDAETEFHLISVADTQEERFDCTEMEARFIARRIRQLLDEDYPVQDGENMRPVRPEDIVILMRSPRARQKAFTAALAKENIPCSTSENENFFATMEIAVMFSLLQIIDNPRQDVPLISVLRSPLFGFTADRLAQIRALLPEGDYYDALVLDESDDSRAFCAALRTLRRMSRELSVDRLVWEIYSRLHVQAVFGAMEGGRQRKEHLTAFYAYAGQMAAAGKKSVFDFVTHLRRLLENDSAPVLNTQTSSAGVQIMSIHKSKGLEFPVVILADLHKNFNQDDFKRPVLVHPQLGLGCERVELERKIRYDTVSKKALALQLRRESMAEEMRILYVAMTRAKEKLIMVDCMRHAAKHVCDLISLTQLPVPPEVALSVNSPGDWILLPLLATQEAAAIHRWAGMEPEQLGLTGGGWGVHLWENPTSAAAGEGEAAQTGRTTVLGDLSGLKKQYAYEKACAVPSKVTATQLKGRELDEEIAQGTGGRHMRHISITQPRFLRQDRGLTAAEKGTAMHLVMQYLPFDTLPEPEAVRAQVELLVQRRLLTSQQAEAVDCGKLAAFLASPLAQEIRTGHNLLREYRFALLVPVSVYDKTVDSAEEMMLQGVVDCCFATDAGLVIVDFKTDRIRAGEEAQRAEVYRPQLEAYAHALEQVLGRKVCRKVLYFFATGEEAAL